ncbi:Ltp family lipoprotein [Nocardioides cavernae]|uniref:Ltp family lipoprotein n=1 Tax=Nocardioides TaxID=1839 RepID=UPI000A6406BC|nr:MULTISPECIES: Ltp family lipoprotein [Nocardioides]MCK9822382.1 Ltp family lipoprotein [Nocardioides cavernae]
MKKKLGALMLASVLSVSVSACEIPEDSGTAADRADVNNKPAKGEKGDKAAAKKDSKPKESVSQANAREAAANYLDYSAFSRTGLIKQLKFEGYSEKDAVYGVDAQKADWMKQAAASGENYLEMSSFSRQGLIDQLKFEGFTPEQAAFGAKKNGL